MATVTTKAGFTWHEVAADRQKHRDATIAAVEPTVPAVPKELPLNVTGIPKQLLTSDEIKITETKVEDLVPALAEGKLTAVTVTKAFLRRAAVAQALANCITELLPQKALERAASLDAILKSTGKPVGPLHGIPISVKEHVAMKGLDFNAGFISWVGNVGEEDSLILQILWDAGAVFYVRTTEPQSLMHLETSSNIYGVTVNPFNTTLTSGGSSGGEGALVGLRGSCLGIGTDIGGSIRSPAANQGLWGYKGTAGRLPVKGWVATMAGEEHILGTIGPLSTSFEGCKLFVKTVLAGKPWLNEPSLLPFEWRELKDREKKLKVAVMWDDGVVRVHPPVTRALKEVVDKLKASKNVEVVDWTPYKHDGAWEIIANLYFADGGAEELAAIEASGEPLRPLTDFIIKQNPHVQTHTIPSLWKATCRREEYRTAYAKLWNEADIDIILCPVGPGVAPKLDTAKYWGYTSQWNLLNYPALIFPVSQVSGEKDGVGEKEKYEPRNEKDRENWALWEKFGAEGYVGAPVSLQIVGSRFRDEEIFQAMEIIVKETDVGDVKFV